MKHRIAAVVAVALLVASAVFAADQTAPQKQATADSSLSLRFGRSIATLFASVADHRQVTALPDGAVIAENPATNVMVARRNRDGSVMMQCVDNEAAARAFFEPANRVPATAPSEVK